MTRVNFTLQLAALIVLMLCASGAAYLSIGGMVLLFPADPVSALALGIGLESAKFATVGYVATTWQSSRWREVHRLLQFFMVGYAVSIISINAVGLYSQLATHVGPHDVADLFRLWPGAEKVIRWLIALGGACSGPLAIILAAGLSAVRCRAA
jgi:hypothetical protein